MTYLLDTHILLWLEYAPHKISGKIKELLVDMDTPAYFSLINFWEIGIKNALNKFEFDVDINLLREKFLQNSFEQLELRFEHLLLVEQLAHHHGDPFDRLLIAQALYHDMTLITADKKIWQYEHVKMLRA